MITCSLHVPEIHLDLQQGTLGGRFTSLEGLLAQVYDELYGRVFSHQSDSMEEGQRTRWTDFLGKLKEAQSGQIPFTLIMDDPLASSYIQNPYAPDEDPEMTVQLYKRTEEQEEELGLAGLKNSREADENGVT